MAAIRDISTIAEKWARVTPQRTTDYEHGVRAPRADWQQAASSAAQAYTQAVTQAAQEGRFAKGVQAAGTQKWQRKALQVGTQRFGPGVTVAEPDYREGFEPYRRVIEATTLPPRGPTGSPQNIQRVAAIAAALHSARVGKK